MPIPNAHKVRVQTGEQRGAAAPPIVGSVAKHRGRRRSNGLHQRGKTDAKRGVIHQLCGALHAAPGHIKTVQCDVVSRPLLRHAKLLRQGEQLQMKISEEREVSEQLAPVRRYLVIGNVRKVAEVGH